MHFFYIDESGDTGSNLEDSQQKIFVLGGISLRDEGWNKTHEEWSKIIDNYFEGNIPHNFELHSHQLLSPNGEGPFQGHDIQKRLGLVEQAIDLIVERKHGVHYVAFDKSQMNTSDCSATLPYDPKTPYFLAFDYMITYVNEIVKNNLGRSARGMLIIDQKDEFMATVEQIFHSRRFSGAKAHRVKWIVEFASAVDSRKNPMVQLSDLVVLCIRRFLEIEAGYTNPPDVVKRFYASCYDTLYTRLKKKKILKRSGAGLNQLNTYLETVESKHKSGWKVRYNVNG